MSDRDSVMRGGVKPLWLRLVGVLAALAMLLAGMVATATADAADNASGDVKLVDGSDVKGVIKGRLDADGWTPDLSDDDPAYVDTLDLGRTSFYGWNTKADGTGDWYIFTGHRKNPAGVLNGVTIDKAPKLANGKLKYPTGGVLYAQFNTFKTYGDFYEKGKFDPSQSQARRDEIKNLTFTTSGWGGRLRGAVYVSACQSNWKTAGQWEDECLGEEGGDFVGDGWKVFYDTLMYADNGGVSEPYSLGYGADPDELDKLLDAAYANSKIKYLNVYVYPYSNGVAPVQIGSIALDRSVAPAPDTAAPVFAGVSDVTVDQGAVFDPLAGVSARDDRDGDVTSAVTVSPSAVDTSKPGETTLTYTVKDKAGNTATVSRVVRVKSVAPDADRDLTEGTRDDGLIGLGVVAPGAKVTLRLPAGYAGRTGDVYVYSAPTVLAVGATVSDEGTLEVALPAGLPAGVHRIVFKPYDASLPLVWDSFEVKAAQEKPVPSTPGKTDTPAGKKPAAKQPLPDTGSDVALVGVAVLVLAAMAGFVLTVRRRG